MCVAICRLPFAKFPLPFAICCLPGQAWLGLAICGLQSSHYKSHKLRSPRASPACAVRVQVGFNECSAKPSPRACCEWGCGAEIAWNPCQINIKAKCIYGFSNTIMNINNPSVL